MIKNLFVILALILRASMAPSIQHIKHDKPKPPPDWWMVKNSMDYYSKYYRIPPEILTSIAEIESPWKANSCDSSYVASKQLGKAGELGPFQIKLHTAQSVWGKNVTRWRLLHDVKFNTATACKILESEFLYWRGRYNNIDQIWLMVCTSYNLGRVEALKLHGKPSKYGTKAYANDRSH